MKGVEEPLVKAGVSRGKVLSVKVPASSANLGPGFDSLGVALNLYMEVQAERSEKWKVTPLSPSLSGFPRNDKNFICQIAKKTADLYKEEMPSLHVSVQSEIPLARGLGSSAAAIVAGVELANEFCGLQMTQSEKLAVASRFEGHPDNAGSSLFGGVVVGSQIGDEFDLTVLDQIQFDPVLVVPKQELLTETSRDVLPAVMEFQRSVQASAVANQLLAALMTQNWALAGRMMRADQFHQPYRKALVPFFEDVHEKAIQSGAFGTALSGAGPSILCLAEPGKGEEVAGELRKLLVEFEIFRLQIDREGCRSSWS
ncbi:homoserine kinase [Mesobacillus boroniphilus]|uniref:Homoserine kinase n=1 Tax=Mesobacillus boroniphilus TaxID=308892 RepID=A0A944CNS1_9BACI|nr:homoserine kinase [Mesobacillus boroniphilus]MBS8265985.1 homoserine kinase [Mesobacillus boroniphilus]